MGDKPDETAKSDQILVAKVGAKAARKLKARADARSGVWFGLGMMGLIGWSVVVPTLAGAALGAWLDRRHTGTYSWTLMLLILGLVLGCWNAWHWVSEQDKSMRDERGKDDE
ncbi:AtpZ/AtpI family protein [soil metagenome]